MNLVWRDSPSIWGKEGSPFARRHAEAPCRLWRARKASRQTPPGSATPQGDLLGPLSKLELPHCPFECWHWNNINKVGYTLCICVNTGKVVLILLATYSFYFLSSHFPTCSLKVLSTCFKGVRGIHRNINYHKFSTCPWVWWLGSDKKSLFQPVYSPTFRKKTLMGGG